MKPSMKQFLNDTKYKNMDAPAQSQGKTQPALELPWEGPLIDLPDPERADVADMSLRQAISERRSVRAYADTTLPPDALSYALWATQGIREQHDALTLRTVPSAGARHAFETILLINRVDGFAAGLYRYVATKHALVRHEAPADTAAKLATACLGQKMVSAAAVTFFWFADIQRMTYRYGERGYRYIFLDAGHVVQNLYLVAEQLKMGTCAIAAYDDDAVNALLGLDGETRFTVYVAPFGKKRVA